MGPAHQVVQVFPFLLQRRIQAVVAARHQHQFLIASRTNLTDLVGEFADFLIGQLLAVLNADTLQFAHDRRIHRHRRHDQRSKHIAFAGFIGADPAGLKTLQRFKTIRFVRFRRGVEQRRLASRRRSRCETKQCFRLCLERARFAGQHQ